MTIIIVIPLVLLAVAAVEVDKRNSITELLDWMKSNLVFHHGVTERVRETTCRAGTGDLIFLCPSVCSLTLICCNFQSCRTLPHLGNAITDLLNKLRHALASHATLTESVCETTCHAIAGLVSFLCGEACTLLVKEISG